MKWVVITENYKEMSYGVRLLHEMCDQLNRMGEEAYVAFKVGNGNIQLSADPRMLSPKLNTPPLLHHIDSAQLRNEAIWIYPEALIGDPFSVKKIVRFFGNKPGYCTPGYAATIEQDAFLLSFSKIFINNPHAVLFSGHVDKYLYDEGMKLEDRTLDLVYHGKQGMYQHLPVFKNTTLIRRDWPERNELATLLKQCRYFYTYDAISHLNNEAVAAGAIPVFMNYFPWAEQEVDSYEPGPYPKGQVVEIKDGYIHSTVDFEKYRLGREEFMKKLKYYQETWDNRFAETVEQIKQYFNN